MNHEAMQRLLRTQPFTPFEIITSAGQVHKVKHPEFALLSKTRVMIVDPESENFVVVPLLHITEARFPAPAEN